MWSLVAICDISLIMTDGMSCQAGHLLDTWSSFDWENGIQVDRLGNLVEFSVRTRNSQYDFTVISSRTGEVLVRGGRFFPQFTPARLAGSSLGGCFLKLLGVYVGFNMELYVNQQRIVTTQVQSVGLVAVRPS